MSFTSGEKRDINLDEENIYIKITVVRGDTEKEEKSFAAW